MGLLSRMHRSSRRKRVLDKVSFPSFETIFPDEERTAREVIQEYKEVGVLLRQGKSGIYFSGRLEPIEGNDEHYLFHTFSTHLKRKYDNVSHILVPASARRFGND